MDQTGCKTCSYFLHAYGAKKLICPLFRREFTAATSNIYLVPYFNFRQHYLSNADVILGAQESYDTTPKSSSTHADATRSSIRDRQKMRAVTLEISVGMTQQS